MSPMESCHGTSPGSDRACAWVTNSQSTGPPITLVFKRATCYFDGRNYAAIYLVRGKVMGRPRLAVEIYQLADDITWRGLPNTVRHVIRVFVTKNTAS